MSTLQTKQCSKCGETKPLTEFSNCKKGKHNKKSICKKCIHHTYLENKTKILEKNKTYYQNNKEKILMASKRWRTNNKEYISNYNKEYREKNNKILKIKDHIYYKSNKEKIKSVHKKYYNKNKSKISAYKKHWENIKYKTDNNFKIKYNIKTRMRLAIKNGYGKKAYKTKELLGCDWETVKQHLESQFAKDMTWDNYGEWHIDHIKPCASFDLTDPTQQKQCFHYTNLQPLWAEDNLKKGDKVIESH